MTIDPDAQQEVKSLFDSRDGICLAGIVLIAVGVAQFSWPAAAIVSGAILVAVATGRLMK
jgi:uncharacterized membrane protein HdeD (DUF308 family)